VENSKTKREKTLVKNTIILAMGQFFPQLSALITLPIYTGMLTTSEYGRYDLINAAVYILNVVVILQIHQAIFRFLIDVRGSSKEKIYVTNAFIFEIIPSVIASIIFGFAYQNLPVSSRVLIGLYLFFNLQYNVSGQIARGLGNNKVYAIGSIINSASNMVLVVVLVSGLEFGFNGLFTSIVCANAFGALFQIVACKQWKRIDFKLFDKNIVKKMIAYSLPMVPNTLSIWIINTSDKFIILFFLGIESNGIFAVAQKIPNIFLIAYSTFNMAWQESASITEKDNDYNAYYNRIFSGLFDFLTGSMLLLISVTPILYKILVRGSYDQAYDQIPLLYIGVFLSSISSFFGSIYIAKKATRAVGISSIIGAIINAVFNLIMIHWAGLYAASISTIISYLVLVTYRMIDIEKRNFLHLIYNRKHIALCILLIVISTVFCYQRILILNIINLAIGIVGFIVLNKVLLKQIIWGIKINMEKRRSKI